MVAYGRMVFHDDAIASQNGPLKIRLELLQYVAKMTPARFDFLYAMSLSELSTQKDLRERLGLHASTISAMAERLEELGFIRQVVRPSDRRRRYLEFTRMGRKAFKRAMRVVFGERAMHRAFGLSLPTEADRLMHFERLWAMACSFRRLCAPYGGAVESAMLYTIPDNPYG